MAPGCPELVSTYLVGYHGAVQADLNNINPALTQWTQDYPTQWQGRDTINVTGGGKQLFELDIGVWTPEPYFLQVREGARGRGLGC